MDIIVCETMRGHNLSDGLVEFNADDVVEDDGGIGDWTDQPNAGEGKLNHILLSFSSAWGGKGQ